MAKRTSETKQEHVFDIVAGTKAWVTRIRDENGNEVASGSSFTDKEEAERRASEQLDDDDDD
jgi:hypothetical protein